MRLSFLGTPAFALPTLAALLDAGHDVAAVYTRAPKPAGRRGLTLTPSPVHALAEARGVAVRTPKSLREPEEQAAFAALDLDVAVVVGYGLLLPQEILAAPRHGCLNLHPSILPRWRGAAPIQRPIMAGDTETAAAIMVMEEGLDTGPVALERRVPIPADATAGDMHDTLAALGATLMVEALHHIEAGSLAPRPQAADGVVYAAKIDKAEARIDWSRPAREVHDLVRGLSPFPGCLDRGRPRQGAGAPQGPARGNRRGTRCSRHPGGIRRRRVRLGCLAPARGPARRSLARPGGGILSRRASSDRQPALTRVSAVFRGRRTRCTAFVSCHVLHRRLWRPEHRSPKPSSSASSCRTSPTSRTKPASRSWDGW